MSLWTSWGHPPLSSLLTACLFWTLGAELNKSYLSGHGVPSWAQFLLYLFIFPFIPAPCSPRPITPLPKGAHVHVCNTSLNSYVSS